MALKENIENLVAGDTLSISFTVLDSSDVPVNVSTATSKMTLKKDLTSSAYFLQSSGSFVTDGTDGEFLFTFTDEQTTNAEMNTIYYYDIEISFADGTRQTPKLGKLFFNTQRTL